MKDLEVSLPVPCSEIWDEMSPRGCNRHCAACDTVIHDLSKLSVEKAEELISQPGGACVRAEIGADGTVALGQGHSARRMKAAVGGSLALAVAACQTTTVTPLYEISGQMWRGYEIELLDGDGVRKTTKAGVNGQFSFKNLPAGEYSLRTYNTCDEEQANVVEVQVGPQDAELGRVEDLWDKCPEIIIGVMVPAKYSKNLG